MRTGVASNGGKATTRGFGVLASRVNRPLLLVSVTALAFGALLAIVSYRQAVQTLPVLALAKPVAAGHLVQADDLRVVRVKTEGGVETVPSADAPRVVGRVAAVTLARGSLLSPAQLRDPGASLDGTTAVVGLTLRDGQLPMSLRPGDLVSLVDTGDAARRSTDGQVVPLVGRATVFATPTTSATGSVVVSVAVARDVAAKVATAAAAGRISLIYLPPDAE